MAQAGRIHTVQGPVEPAALGRTLPHEHVFCDFYRITGNLNHSSTTRNWPSKSWGCWCAPAERRWSR